MRKRFKRRLKRELANVVDRLRKKEIKRIDDAKSIIFVDRVNEQWNEWWQITIWPMCDAFDILAANDADAVENVCVRWTCPWHVRFLTITKWYHKSVNWSTDKQYYLQGHFIVSFAFTPFSFYFDVVNPLNVFSFFILLDSIGLRLVNSFIHHYYGRNRVVNWIYSTA